jgi:hypothetical protein
MPTNVFGQQAREHHEQQVHYLRVTIVPTPGVFQPFPNALPAGANILRVSTAIRTVFNGTTPTLSVGTSGTPGQVVNAAATATWDVAGRNNPAMAASAAAVSFAAVTQLGVTLAGAGMNAGDGDVEIEYTVRN